MLNHFTPTSPPGISHIATDLLGAIGFQHPPNRPSRFPCSLCTILPSLAPRACCPCLHSMSFPAGPVHRYFSPCAPSARPDFACCPFFSSVDPSERHEHAPRRSICDVIGGALVRTPTWASKMPATTRSKTKSQNQAQEGRARKHASENINSEQNT